MKEMKNNKKQMMNKRPCEKCNNWFDENDLDIVNGEWLCRSEETKDDM